MKVSSVLFRRGDDALANRVVELEAALEEAIDVAIWMSGSSSFAPDGEAGEHWPSQRERLYAAMAARGPVSERRDDESR